MATDITLTDEQAGAVKAVCNWYREITQPFGNSFVLGGYAGTGKTTILRFIVDELGLTDVDVRFVAYTGKAANVLRKKGVPATTIHSLIYRPMSDGHGAVKFVLKYFGDCMDRVKLIICDESSMIGRTIQTDLESYGVPVLYVGDHFQLPPVSKDQINLMASPDYRLETIHRQALDNPIIRLAHEVRSGNHVGYGSYDGMVMKIPDWKAKDEYLLAADQVICGFNNTRKYLNRRIRKLLGKTNIYPEPGDKLICLKNNNMLGLVNGMLGTCQEYYEDTDCLVFENDDGIGYGSLLVDGLVFSKGEAGPYQKGIEQFDYGYALTCHKFQGSEAPKVVVFQELFGGDDEMHRRWMYTAYTRASEKLIIVD